MLSDAELVARVTGFDDQAAFQVLVERHQAAVRGFLHRLLAGDHGTADDLAQETFLTAYRKLGTLKSGERLVSWLHSIAYRQFLQHLRKHERQRVMAEPPEPGHDPRAAMDAEYLAPRLLAEASPPERACLTLAYAAGMSHAEVSEITGLPVGTVKSHITRGKQKLQNWLERHDHSLSTPTLPKQESHRA
ncbi:MAG: RNA polymerase sigma factor [Xanthomonadales bacterium]|jgi:RNA polymerase sigma-70 factor, ECF subfamily